MLGPAVNFPSVEVIVVSDEVLVGSPVVLVLSSRK